MSNKIIGYSYFGRSRGLQTVNGGGIPSNYPVEDIIDLDMQIFEIKPNTRLYRVSRILQGNKMKQFISIYEYAEEKDSHRTGTFLGATIGLDHSIVSPEIITTCLVGMIEYLSKYLNNDGNRKFVISELKEQSLKSPSDFQTLNSLAKSIEFSVGKPENKSSLTALRKSHELLDANAFFYHALNQNELYKYGELYATADEKIVIKHSALYPLKLDLHFDSAIERKLTELENIEQKKINTINDIETKEKSHEEKEALQISKLNKIEVQKEKINKEIGELKKEKEKIENTLQVRNTSLKGLPDNIEKLKNESEKLKDEGEKLTGKIKELEKSYSDKFTEFKQLGDQIEKNETLNDELKRKIEQANLDCKIKSDEVLKLKEVIEDYEAKVKEKTAELESIDKNIANTKNKREQVVEEETSLKETPKKEESKKWRDSLSFFLKNYFSKKKENEKPSKGSNKAIGSILILSFVGVIIFFTFYPFEGAKTTEKPYIGNGKPDSETSKETPVKEKPNPSIATSTSAQGDNASNTDSFTEDKSYEGNKESSHNNIPSAQDDRNRKILDIQDYLLKVENQNNDYTDDLEKHIKWLQDNKVHDLNSNANVVYWNWRKSGYAKFQLYSKIIEYQPAQDGVFRTFVSNNLHSRGIEEQHVGGQNRYLKFLEICNPNDLIDNSNVKPGAKILFFFPEDEYKKVVK